ncbi:hypothetical protein ABPG74_007724 [Tetrahymena malaccensis]
MNKIVDYDDLMSLSLPRFLKVIRFIHDLTQRQQAIEDQKLIHENIISMHESQCFETNQLCFCHKFRELKEKKDFFLMKEVNQYSQEQYVQSVILHIIEQYGKETLQAYQSNDFIILKLFLLNYLYDAKNGHLKVLINMQQIQQFWVNTGKMKSTLIFYFYQLKETIIENYQEIQHVQNLENQNIKMMDIIQFGDQIKIFKEKLRSALIQTGEFYDLLCRDYIPLNQIESMSLPLIKLKEDIEQNIIQLFKMNPNDLNLQYLASIFSQVLDFQNRRISELQKLAFISLKSSQKQQHLFKQNQLFGENCVIYSSLLQNSYVINLASNSFYQVFGVKPDQIIGKQINILVPNAVQNVHNQMIQQFIEEDSINIIQKGQRHLFALDKQGFVFPITIRIKMEIFNEDFGICALIQKQSQQKQYIIFQDDGIITDYSKQIYYDLFQNTESNKFSPKKVTEASKYSQVNKWNKIKIQTPLYSQIFEQNKNELQNGQNNHKYFLEQYIKLIQSSKKEIPEQQLNITDYKYAYDSTQQIFSDKINHINKEKNKQLFKGDLTSNLMQTANSNQTEPNLSPYFSSQQREILNLNNQYDSNLIMNPCEQENNQLEFHLNNNQQQSNKIELQQIQLYDYEKATEKNILEIFSQQKFFSDDQLSLRINDYDKKQTKSTNFQEKEEQKQEKQIEIASLNSSKFSSVEIIKNNMIKRIKQSNLFRSLKFLVFTGFVAVLTLLSVTSIIYFQNLNSLNNFISSFLKIDSAIFCFIDVMKELASTNYQFLLGSPFIIDDIQLQYKEFIQADYQQDNILLDYKYNFQQLVLNNESLEQLDDLQNNPFQVQIYATNFYIQANIQTGSIAAFIQSLQYTIMEFFYQIVLYVNSYQEQQEDFIWGNIVQFKQRMNNLQLIVEKFVQQQFNSMGSLQTFVIILVSVLSFLIVFLIIPLNISLQMQREKVMKLFGSFQPQILEFWIQLIELAISKLDKTKSENKQNKNVKNIKSSKNYQSILLKDLMEQGLEHRQNNIAETNQQNLVQYDQFPIYIRRQQNSRNRSIASFSSLQKFNLISVFLGVIVVLILCIQPVLNILLFNPFQAQSDATLEERISLINIYTLLIENQASYMESIYCTVINQLYQTNYYQTYIQNLTQSNQQAIQYLQNLTQNFGIKRYDQNLYNNFYETIMNKDVCLVRQKFPQYFNSNITQADCELIFEGILKRGLIISINQAFQTFEGLKGMFVFDDLNQQLEFFVQFQNSYSFVQLNQLVSVISESVDAIRQYQNESLQEMGISLLKICKRIEKNYEYIQSISYQPSL